MSDSTLAALPAATPLGGADLLYVEQSGASAKATVADLRPFVALKSGDETRGDPDVGGDGTEAVDSDVAFPIGAYASWVADLSLVYTTDGGARLLASIDVPVGASGVMTWLPWSWTGVEDLACVFADETEVTVPSFPGYNGGILPAILRGRIVVTNGSTPGAVAFKWGSSVENGMDEHANVVLLAGSHVIAHKV